MTNTRDNMTRHWHIVVVVGPRTKPVCARWRIGAENELKLLLRVAADFARRGLCDNLVSSLPD